MASIRDVAAEAGVSISTVSRVLSGTVFVEPETKKRVQKAVKDLDYKPNLAARSLKRGNSKLLGLIIPDITNAYYPELVNNINAVASKYGYSIILCETMGDVDREKQFFETLKYFFVSGIIYIASTDDISFVEQYIGEIPIVFLNRFFDVSAPCINVKNEESTYEATKYLIEKGHRRIAVIIGSIMRQYNQERLEGVKKAFEESGITGYEKYILYNVDGISSAYEKTMELLKLSEPPTAFFLFSDYLATGVYNGISSSGFSIPKDISVMGFDDTPQAKYLIPPLTTIRHPCVEKAEEIFSILMEESKSIGKQKKWVSYDGIFIERESVAEAKNKEV